MQLFNNPNAIKTIATGTNNATPLANIKHTISTGAARISKTVAIIFANPQVILKASPIPLINNHPHRIIMAISKISSNI